MKGNNQHGGLIAQQRQEQSSQARGGAQSGQGGSVQFSEEQVTPEEQAEYEKVMKPALQKLYSPEVFDAIVKLVDGGEKLPMAMGTVVGMLLDACARETNVTNEDVLFGVAEEMIEELSGSLEEAKRFGQISDEMMEEAMGKAMEAWAGARKNEIDPNDVNEIGQAVGVDPAAAAGGAQ